MTEPEQAKPLMGALIAVAGLVVAFALLRYIPDGIRSAISGGISGGFGVLAVSQIWPGLPLRKVHLWLGSVVAYGVVVALVGRI